MRFAEGTFARDASPLATPIYRDFPSGDTARDDGYHPVGMKPFSSERFGFRISITATLLLSALATKSSVPAALTATASGVDPTGSEIRTDVFIVSIAWRPRSTVTLLDPAFATNSRPSGPKVRSLG